MNDGRTLVTFDDEVGPYLKDLSERFPREFKRALRNVAWRMRSGIGTILATGSFEGQRLEPRADMTWQRSVDRLKAGKATKRGTWSRYREFEKLSLKRRFALASRSTQHFGRIARAVQTKAEFDGRKISVGFLLPRVSRWGFALQKGQRGTEFRFQFDGDQPITPAMRRMFFALGMPIPRAKTHFTQPERRALAIVFNTLAPRIPEWVRQRIQDIMDGKTPGGN